MKQITELIEHRKREVALHPLYAWMRNDCVGLPDRLAFAPVFVNFIMGFRDLNRWFLRYADANDPYRQAINAHTQEDEGHSKFFLEDWAKLGLDRRLGWGAGETLWWYYAAGPTELFRSYGMELMEMSTLHSDPLLRFALMESIEACGHVFFGVTCGVAEALEKQTGTEYRYFGRFHLMRETGHLLGAGHIFEEAEIDPAREALASALANRIFDMFLVENDRLLAYAEEFLAGKRAPASLREAAAPDSSSPEVPSLAQRKRLEPPPHPSQQGLEEALAQRKIQADEHPFFAWMRAPDRHPAKVKLQRFIPLWVPDIMGYRDLTAYALAYRHPANPRERAINRWLAQLQTHHRLFIRDWAALEMDALLSWTASDTLTFLGLSRHTDLQRKSMASFVKLAYGHPKPALRFWLLEALEASGEAFFKNTRALALRFETESSKRLDYLADRHPLSHPTLERDDAADAVAFRQLPLNEAEQRIALEMIHTVFDCLEAQYTQSLELAGIDLFNAIPPVTAAVGSCGT